MMLLPFLGHFLGHLAGTATGSSGCPVLREKNGQWFVVGIHIGHLNGVNVASLMPNVCQYLQGSCIPGEDDWHTQYNHVPMIMRIYYYAVHLHTVPTYLHTIRVCTYTFVIGRTYCICTV